jgi:hypothetical protein
MESSENLSSFNWWQSLIYNTVYYIDNKSMAICLPAKATRKKMFVFNFVAIHYINDL